MCEIPWFLSGERKTFEGIASPELGILWKYFSNIRYFYIFYRNVFLLQNFEAMFLWNEKAIQIVAGPCSVESEEQLFATARGLKKIGIQTLRGGIWKPRSRAHHFEGVGESGLRWLQQVQQELSMQVATEVATPRQAEVALKYGIDILWIGARTTVSPFMIQEIAEVLRGGDTPVMLKNPVCPDLELWTGAVERLLDIDLKQLSLIHRGFSVLDAAPYRNIPCLEMALEMKKRFPGLPLFCDPSHICGKRGLLYGICAEALRLDMDGLFIESHCCPEVALSDAAQQLTPEALGKMFENLGIRQVENNKLHLGCEILIQRKG